MKKTYKIYIGYGLRSRFTGTVSQCAYGLSQRIVMTHVRVFDSWLASNNNIY